MTPFEQRVLAHLEHQSALLREIASSSMRSSFNIPPLERRLYQQLERADDTERNERLGGGG